LFQGVSERVRFKDCSKGSDDGGKDFEQRKVLTKEEKAITNVNN